jgi:hypothetical protein
MELIMDSQVVFNLKFGVYFAVIIDIGTNRKCTVYPVDQLKPGKLFVPKKTK